MLPTSERAVTLKECISKGPPLVQDFTFDSARRDVPSLPYEHELRKLKSRWGPIEDFYAD